MHHSCQGEDAERDVPPFLQSIEAKQTQMWFREALFISIYNSEGYLNSEIHAPDDIRPRRERSTAATLISMIIVVPYVGILIACMVALGFMAVTHNSVRNYDLFDGHCLLYATHDTVGDTDVFKLSKGPVCKFIIYGEGALGVLAVVLILLSVVKAIVGKW